jgi:prophage tail gpP-like protein
VQRYRPLIVIAEERGPHASYKQRAEWERNVRRGRSNRATITVQGWRNAAGQLWQPNTMVHLKSAWLGVDTDLLVVGVAFSLDGQSGTRTELRLSERCAFDLIVGKKAAGLQGKIREKQESEKKKSGDDWSAF